MHNGTDSYVLSQNFLPQMIVRYCLLGLLYMKTSGLL